VILTIQLCQIAFSARVTLTSYTMGRVELLKKLSCRPEFSFFRVFKSLTNAFCCISVGGNVEQALISFSVLTDGPKHHGPLTFSRLFHKVIGPATEG